MDRANVLNYESDSSEGSDDEGSLSEQMEKQKEAVRMNDAWGKNKKSYYKGKDESDSGQSSDEDQALEAERLQKIRRQKLAKQFAAKEISSSDSEEEVKSASSDSDNSDDQPRRKLGDALFAADDDHHKEEVKQLSVLDKKVVKQIIESDSPEMIGILQEFREALDTANNKLQPILEKLKAG